MEGHPAVHARHPNNHVYTTVQAPNTPRRSKLLAILQQKHDWHTRKYARDCGGLKMQTTVWHARISGGGSTRGCGATARILERFMKSESPRATKSGFCNEFTGQGRQADRNRQNNAAALAHAAKDIITLRSTTSEFKLRNLDPVGIDWTPFKILPPQTTCCSASVSMWDSTMQHGRIWQCLSLHCASFAGSARKLWPWPNASSCGVCRRCVWVSSHRRGA